MTWLHVGDQAGRVASPRATEARLDKRCPSSGTALAGPRVMHSMTTTRGTDGLPDPSGPPEVPPEIDPPGTKPPAPEPTEDPQPISQPPRGPEVVPPDKHPRPSIDPGRPPKSWRVSERQGKRRSA